MAKVQISIHAPREGSDGLPSDYTSAPMRISIHAPREGSDRRQGVRRRLGSYFYPRSPRGERRPGGSYPGLQSSISIHAPREGSDEAAQSATNAAAISIHAPREGSDIIALRLRKINTVISIHAPREGSDQRGAAAGKRHGYFYPRSPRGERRCSIRSRRSTAPFLSTLPARGAT